MAEDNGNTIGEETEFEEVNTGTTQQNSAEKPEINGNSAAQSTTKKDPWQPDNKGKVDLRDIFNEFVSGDPDPAAPSNEPEKPKEPGSEKSDSSSSSSSEKKPEGGTKVDASDVISGELAFETTDFIAISVFCWWGKTGDEDLFKIPQKRKERLIKLWDIWLKSIDYKVSPGVALAICSAAVYAPLAATAHKNRGVVKKEEKQAAKQSKTQTESSSSTAGEEKVNIPDPPKFKMPSKGVQGQKSNLQKEYEKIILEQSQWITDITERLKNAGI